MKQKPSSILNFLKPKEKEKEIVVMERQLQAEKREMTVSEVVNQVNKIREIMKAVMKEGMHYGIIPGCDKPSLWKPGAEKIAMTFKFAPDPKCEDLSTSDEIKYRVVVNLLDRAGKFLGAGIGECSSNEEKYRWRKAVCDDEYAMFEREGNSRLKYKKDRYGKIYTIKQVRMVPADVGNTIVKMAKKRGYVDGVLTITAASDIFTQDIEDMPTEYIGAKENNSTPAPPQPKQSQAKELKEEIYKFGGNKVDDTIISKFQREHLEEVREKNVARTGIQKDALDDCEIKYCKLHNTKGFRKPEINILLHLMTSFDAFANYYEKVCEDLIEKENTA